MPPPSSDAPLLQSFPGNASLRDVLWAGLPSALVVAICLSFFLPKALTIDDPMFVRAAHQAIRTPLHPFAFDMCWLGDGKVRRFSQFVANAPLMAYVLIPAVISGAPEVVGHAMEILLLVIAALATASIALRMGLSRSAAFVAAGLTATCPAVLGMAASLMPDILAMTLAVVAFERFVAWRQSGGWGNAALAVIALALGPMARLQVALMIPACALLSFEYASWPCLRENWRRSVPGGALAVLAALLYTAVVLVTRDPGARSAAIPVTLVSLAPGSVLSRGLSLGSYLALTTPFVAGVLWAAVRQRFWRFAAILLFSGPMLMAGITGKRGWTVAAIAALGYLCLAWTSTQLWKIRSGPALALALWTVFPFAVVIYVHMTPKYLVPSVPAYSLLLLMLPRPALSRWFWGALSGVGLTLGLLIVSADARSADLARFAVEKWVPPLKASGKRVQFLGQWGFQWYAQLDGAGCFDPNSSTSAGSGDYVIVDLLGGEPFPRILYPRGRLVDVVSNATPGGVVLDKDRNIGFYSDSFGHWPWTWAPAGTQRYELWKIE